MECTCYSCSIIFKYFAVNGYTVCNLFAVFINKLNKNRSIFKLINIVYNNLIFGHFTCCICRSCSQIPAIDCLSFSCVFVKYLAVNCYTVSKCIACTINIVNKYRSIFESVNIVYNCDYIFSCVIFLCRKSHCSFCIIRNLC